MIYLLHGPDEFSRSEALAEHLAAFPPDLAELNVSRLDGRRLRLDGLVAACEAAPFLADRRLVIVTDALKHLKAGKERDELVAYLDRVPAQCDLIFLERDDVDRRGALYNRLLKLAEVHEFKPLEGHELTRWVNERARRLDARLDGPAAQRLLEYVGADGRAILNELTKLATYVGRGGRITTSEVDLLVQDRQEQNLFAFIDELSGRRRGAALRGLRMLLDEGQAAAYIMFMLARQVRILIGARDLAARKLRPEQVAAELGQKPFVVRKALDQARLYGPGELEQIHDRLLELDHAIKTGRIPAETALELLVAEICTR